MPFHFVGVLVNPKLAKPAVIIAEQKAVTVLSMMDWKEHGDGYFESSDDGAESVTGCARVHTPNGADPPRQGWGTVLYGGLALVASMEDKLQLHLNGPCICSHPEHRSVSASSWWERARTRRLAYHERGEDEEVTAENIDMGHGELDDHLLGESVSYKRHDWTVSYVNSVNVDLAREVPGEEADASDISNFDRAGLVVARGAVYVGTGTAPAAIWRKVRDDAEPIEEVRLDVLMALNVVGLDESAINLLGVLAQLGGATEEQLWGLRYRWEYGLDPSEPIRQTRFKFNGEEAQVVQQSLDETARLRSALGWDSLADLDE